MKRDPCGRPSFDQTMPTGRLGKGTPADTSPGLVAQVLSSAHDVQDIDAKLISAIIIMDLLST